MKSLDVGRFLLSSCVAAAMFAGCGGSQPPIGAPGAMPQGVQYSNQRLHKTSGSSGDLIYVTTSKAIVVVSYPNWQIVATIPGNWSNNFICSDPKTGNVFVTSANYSQSPQVIEYAHGGTTPIATLNVPSGYYYLFGCSVDPTTGNLAVAATGAGFIHGAILVYVGAQGNPVVYSDKKHVRMFASPAYDNAGDLFAGATTKIIHFPIAELPAGKKRFTIIRLNEDVFGYKLQWDGTYLAFENWNGPNTPSTLYQVQISGDTGTVVGSEQVFHAGTPASIWIHDGLLFGFFAQVKRSNNHAVAVWPYPTGGEPTSKFYGITKGKNDDVVDLTLSIQPSH
jgi:hypothetical protein